MTILLNNDGHWHEKYLAALAKYLPGRRAEGFPNISNPEDIEYALIWKHPDGDLLNYPNLKAVFSLGSGTDYLDAHKALPEAPIFRLIDPNMADDMALYTLYWVIHIQRGMEILRTQQKQQQWQRYATLQNLSEMDIVVSMLPANRSTKKFLDRDIFSKMKKGSSLINISRGAVVDEEDLLESLNSGHIANAVLDVFAAEPLPKNSPFWTHPNVHVTPHMSGATNPDTSVKIIAENIRKFEAGITPLYPYLREDV